MLDDTGKVSMHPTGPVCFECLEIAEGWPLHSLAEFLVMHRESSTMRSTVKKARQAPDWALAVRSVLKILGPVFLAFRP